MNGPIGNVFGKKCIESQLLGTKLISQWKVQGEQTPVLSTGRQNRKIINCKNKSLDNSSLPIKRIGKPTK